MPPVPPWAVGNTPEPVSLDIDCFVDVTPYVRFETGHSDIDYGVLDIQVSFQHEGRHTSVYLLHYFALAENYPKCGAVIAGWVDNFDFPPALAKMIVRYQERTINVCVQYCLAVNDRGISVYGSNEGYRWRLVRHILYHERQLLELFDTRVAASSRTPVGHPPVTWSWARPQGLSPRQTGCWAQRHGPRPSHDPTQDLGEASGQRFIAREHYRVDTALFNRVQAMIASLRDAERLLPQMPGHAQRRMCTHLLLCMQSLMVSSSLPTFLPVCIQTLTTLTSAKVHVDCMTSAQPVTS